MDLFKNAIQNIDIKKIDGANRFLEFSILENSDSLEQSIEQFGILQPLWIFKEENSLVILAGFKRYDTAHKLGLNEIPVRWLRDNTTIEHAFQQAITEQKSHRVLNIIEIAKILYVVRQFGYSDKEIPETFLSLLNLPPNPKILKKYNELLSYSDKIQNYISRYDLSLKQSEIFKDFREEEQGLLIDLAENLSLKSHELRELSIHLYEIARRKKENMTVVWKHLDLESILNDIQKNRNQKIQIIRKRLKDERFPILVETHERITKKLSDLSLTTRGKWSWDPNFERPGLVYHFEVVTLEDCERAVNDFSSEQNRQTLSTILERI